MFKLHEDSDTTEGTRGYCLKLFLERVHLNVGKESFSLRVTELWNDLLEVVVTAPSVISSKNRQNGNWSTEEFLLSQKT